MCDSFSGTFGNHLFYTDDSLERYSDVLCRTIVGQMPDSGFNRFIRFCVNYKKVEIVPVVHHTFTCDLASVSGTGRHFFSLDTNQVDLRC